MPTVWEETNGCAKNYRCALAIYLISVLSSSYGIIMYCAINAPGRGKKVVDGLNTMNKSYLKGGMELIDKLGSKNTTKIGILPSY